MTSVFYAWICMDNFCLCKKERSKKIFFSEESGKKESFFDLYGKASRYPVNKLCFFKKYVNIFTMKEIFTRYGISLTEEKLTLFNRFYLFLTEENEKYNLTAVTEKSEVYEKHFVDSLLCVDKLYGKTLLDVGSGCGMPGIPLAIAREDMNITLLESTGKKCAFLEKAAALLGLKNVSVVNARAEDAAKGALREKFDVVTARGVARMNTLAEYCLPFVKVGGTFVAFKAQAEEELAEAKKALEILGGKVDFIVKKKLGEAERQMIFVKKVNPTPAKYPRGNGKERKCPL